MFVPQNNQHRTESGTPFVLVAAMLLCGAGNLACSRLLGGAWLQLCCFVGQDCILLAGFQPAFGRPYGRLDPMKSGPQDAILL
jgi:hypothetical protein